jgi:hypothetical protein
VAGTGRNWQTQLGFTANFMSNKVFHRARLVVLTSALLLVAAAVQARGVSPYLPLQVSPEIEREIERLFTLAGMPVLRKPYFAGDVAEALHRGCQVPSSVCDNVAIYLDRYKNNWGLTDASAVAMSDDDADKFVPNQRGRRIDSNYSAFANAYWQFSDHILLNASGIAFKDEVLPTAYLSLGYDFAQVDIGWRERWWSPFQDSAVLLSTNARPSLSIGISNYRPLTFLKLRYEVFYADLEETDGILFQDERHTGRPGLFGVHLGIEPLEGFSISVNRVMQYGGGPRSKSLSTLLKAFFDPAGQDNQGGTDDEAGNQIASATTRFDFTGRVPFSIYMEYAGEDTSSSKAFRLGNVALSVGLFVPQVTRDIDLTYEFSDFQNGWYVNAIYANGYTNDGSVIGHWAGNEREFGDAVATQTHTVRVNWEFSPGNLLHGTFRTIDNAEFSQFDYVRGYEGLLRYSRAISTFIGGVEIYSGRTTRDETFTTLGVFLRW